MNNNAGQSNSDRNPFQNNNEEVNDGRENNQHDYNKHNNMGNQNADVGYQNMIASPMMQLFDDNTEFILESNINKVQDRRFNQPNQQRQIENNNNNVQINNQNQHKGFTNFKHNESHTQITQIKTPISPFDNH